MRPLLKTIAAHALQPMAVLTNLLGSPVKRIWAHSRLACSIERPLDASVVVLGTVEVHGTGNIRIGRNVLLYPGVYLETQDDGEVVIGDGVVISTGTHVVAFQRVEIESGSMIGEYCSIRDANHLRARGVTIRESGHTASPIRIGHEVWIGRGTVILAGVTIGDAATIGANAVVTRNIPAGEIHAGVPARQIRPSIDLPGEDSSHVAATVHPA